MNLSHFIAKRLSESGRGKFTATVISLSILTVSLGVASLLIAFSILGGFKTEIRSKLFSFDSHIQIKHAGANFGLSIESAPLSVQTELYQKAKNIPDVKNICAYINKGGIIQANGEISGVNVKGVNVDFDTLSFSYNLQEGSFVDLNEEVFSRGIVVSRKLARRMQLQLHDTVNMYFYVNERIRPRKLSVNGIYSTGLEDVDEKIVLSDIRLLQQINLWPDTLVGGYDIVIHDVGRLDEAIDRIAEYMDMDMGAWKITDRYYAIFDWLLMIDKNVVVLIVILFIITFFNIIASVVILMMERVRMIGLFKALGASDGFIQNVFWKMGMRILWKGLLCGNIVGLGFCAMQYYFQFIPLDAENYYMAYVPVTWDWMSFALINIGVFTLLSLVLALPLFIAKSISPIKAIRFD